MILVTGATGLLGSHLILQLLEKQQDVVAFYRKSSKLDHVKKIFEYYYPAQQAENLFNKIQWRQADITNPQEVLNAMDDIDQIYHCAAIVSFSPNKKDLIFNVNVNGTANMVNAALEKGVKKFIYASSIATLGNTEDQLITEDTYAVPKEKVSVYSKSKYYAEMEVWRGKEEGLNIIIVNPSVILGPLVDWKRKLIGRIMFQTWVGLPFYIEGTTGYVDVRDVAKAMIMLADKNIFGERFIVSAENLTFKQILDMLADALDRPRPKYKLNEFFLSTAYILDQFRTLLTLSDPILTKENIKYINMNNRYSSQKLLNALPEFKFTPIKETIQLMAKIFINSLSDEEKKAKGSYIKALKSIID